MGVVLDAVRGQGHERVLERGAHQCQFVKEQSVRSEELADRGGVESLDPQLVLS